MLIKKIMFVTLIFMAAFGCKKKDDDGGGGDGGIPTGKSGTLSKDTAGTFVNGDKGGLVSLEKFSGGTQDSKTAVGQLQSNAGSAALVEDATEEEEDDDCDATTDGDKTDADLDGFYKEYSVAYDCEFEKEKYTYTRSGTISITDDDDADKNSNGTFDYKDLKFSTKLTNGGYDITFSYLTNGYFKKVVDGATRTAEVKFGTSYELSGLPAEADSATSEFSAPSFYYNMTTSHATEAAEITVDGFYRAAGSYKNSETSEMEKYNYALEITTEEPLKITETCSAKYRFGGGKIIYEAGSGIIAVTYGEDCERTVTFNDEAI
jgi:hypothetical protein